MNTIFLKLKQKKGMTLIETIIAFLIAGILIAATSALIITGLNLFQSTAARNLDKSIGDSVLEIVRDQIKYARAIEPATNYTIPISEDTFGTAGAFFIGESTSAPIADGELFLKRPGENEEFFAVFPNNSFYSGRTVKLDLTVDRVEEPKAITLTVRVMDGSEVKYNRSTSFKLLNSTSYDPPTETVTWNSGDVIKFVPVE